QLTCIHIYANSLHDALPIYSPASYHQFMKDQLFDHVDIDPKNTHIPDGTVAKEDIKAYCREYEQKIEDAGGIDLQILGIGTNAQDRKSTRLNSSHVSTSYAV